MNAMNQDGLRVYVLLRLVHLVHRREFSFLSGLLFTIAGEPLENSNNFQTLCVGLPPVPLIVRKFLNSDFKFSNCGTGTPQTKTG